MAQRESEGAPRRGGFQSQSLLGPGHTLACSLATVYSESLTPALAGVFVALYPCVTVITELPVVLNSGDALLSRTLSLAVQPTQPVSSS